MRKNKKGEMEGKSWTENEWAHSGKAGLGNMARKWRPRFP